MDMRRYYLDLPMPLRWHPDRLLMDIECVKVQAPVGWPVKTRFRTTVVGFVRWAKDDVAEITQWFLSANTLDDEAALIERVDKWIEFSERVLFAATRNFDRRVLEARWTSARKAFATEPGAWPHISLFPENKWWNYRNARTISGAPYLPEAPPRPADLISGKDCLTVWYSDPEQVLRRNLTDLEGMASQFSRRGRE